MINNKLLNPAPVPDPAPGRSLEGTAALRRLRKRVVVKKQINVANGPMLIDNRGPRHAGIEEQAG